MWLEGCTVSASLGWCAPGRVPCAIGLFHLGVPPWLVDWAADVGLRRAVETGTYDGESAARLAVTPGHCTTIERSAVLAERATARFAGMEQIEVLVGSSRDLLPKVCAQLDEPTLFWLDAHWSGQGTPGQDDPCPLMAGSKPSRGRRRLTGTSLRSMTRVCSASRSPSIQQCSTGPNLSTSSLGSRSSGFAPTALTTSFSAYRPRWRDPCSGFTPTR